MVELSVLLPAYKEEENLKILLPKIREELLSMKISFEILVVDTMQPIDDTKKVCEQFQVQYCNREDGNNYGDAVRTGIAKANSKWLLIMDADGSHSPQDIPRLYEEAEKGYGIVIGSRYMKGGNSHNGIILKAMSYLVNVTYRLLFKIKAKDVSNSFRIYSMEHIKKLCLTSVNFDIVEEILILFNATYPDCTVAEVPIYFNKRLYGESKRDLLKFAFSYMHSIVFLFKTKRTITKL